MSFTVGNVIRERAKADPQRRAIASERRSLTWAELYANARGIAQALRRNGIGPQDRVSFLDRNGIEHFEFIFGCALLNAIPVPINWRLSADEIASTLNDAGSKLLIVGEEYHSIIESVADRLSADVRLVSLADHPVWERFTSWYGDGSAADPMEPVRPDDIALHFYSSGTTGKPKGILWSAGNAEYLLRDTAVAYGIVREDINLLTMPLFHSGGTGWALCGMIKECESITVRNFDAKIVLETIWREQVTVAMFVPAMLTALCDVAESAGPIGHLRQINYTGSPITEQGLIRAMAVFRCDFIQNY